jgi:hypothetical protein
VTVRLKPLGKTVSDRFPQKDVTVPLKQASSRVSSYRHNKTTDRAVVTIDGRDFWLGKFGSPESKQQYQRLIAEWLAGGRQLWRPVNDLSVLELIARFWSHAEMFYRKPDGRPTSELDNFRQALRPLKELYSDSLAREFGPLCLAAVRDNMIRRG